MTKTNFEQVILLKVLKYHLHIYHKLKIELHMSIQTLSIGHCSLDTVHWTDNY